VIPLPRLGAPVHRPFSKRSFDGGVRAPVALLPEGKASPPWSAASYRASGVILVNRDSLLNQITSVQNQNSFGFDTPATYTSRQFNTLLGTDAFLKSVIIGGGLTSAIDSGAITAQGLRKSLWAAPDGDELVVINAKTPNPELLPARVNDQSYLQWQVDNNVRRANRPSSSSVPVAPNKSSIMPARRSRPTSGIRRLGATPTVPPTSRSRSRPSPRPVNRADDQPHAGHRSSARLASGQASTDVAQRPASSTPPEQPTAPRTSSEEGRAHLMLFLARHTVSGERWRAFAGSRGS
jgi:hypothetical protein